MIFLKIKNKIDTLCVIYGKKLSLDLGYLVKNGLWVIIGQIIAGSCGLILSIFFARMINSEILGQYQLLLSILAIISVLSIPGLNTSIGRSVARGKDGNYIKAVKISFFWSLLGIPTMLVTGLYYYVNSNETVGLSLMLASIFFPFMYAPNTWQSFLQAKSKFDILTKFSSVQTIINTIFVIGSVILASDMVHNALVIIFITYVISYSLMNIIFYKKTLDFIENSETDSDSIHYGFFLTRMGFFQLIAENIDKLLIAFFISPSALAAYYVLSILPLKFKGLFKPFYGILFPKMAKLEESIISVIKKKTKAVMIGTIFMVVVAVCYYFSIEFVETIIYGEKYSEYYGLSKYYVILLILFIPLNVLSKYVYARQYKKTIFLVSVVYPLIKIIINVLCILFFGLVGAVLAYNINVLLWFSFYIAGVMFEEKKLSKS